MNNPEVSIIIATFNAEKTLRKALESVKNQSFQNWECIVVDGASKDGTVEVIKEYIKTDGRFRFISEPDKGIYDAFNKGFRMAKGEWVYYLGADDIIYPESIKQLETYLKGWDVDIVYGNVMEKLPDGRKYKGKVSTYEALPNSMLASHQAIFTRRSLLRRLNGFDLDFKIIGDMDFYVRAHLTKQCSAKFVDNLIIAEFAVGGVSSNKWGCFKEEVLIWKKNKLKLSFLLFQLCRLLWMLFKDIFKINKSFPVFRFLI